MQPSASARMTADEFLNWLQGQERRHELVDGVPMAMAGAKRQHDQVVVNVLRELSNQLRKGPCRPFTADTAIRIPSGNIRMPDAGVDCGTFDPAAVTADQPTVVVEVLSPSTRQLDLHRKLEEYKSVPSIAHILLVDPDEPEAVRWRREAGGWSFQAHEGLDAAITLDNPAFMLRFTDLYEGLTFRPKPRLVLE